MSTPAPDYVTSAELRAFESRIAERIEQALEKHKTDTERRLGPVFTRLATVEQRAAALAEGRVGDMNFIRESVKNIEQHFATAMNQIVDMFQKSLNSVEKMDTRLDKTENKITGLEEKVEGLRGEVFGKPGHNKSLVDQVTERFDQLVQGQGVTQNKIDAMVDKIQERDTTIVKQIEVVTEKVSEIDSTVMQLQAQSRRWRERAKHAYAVLKEMLSSRPGVLLIIRLGGVILAGIMMALGADALVP